MPKLPRLSNMRGIADIVIGRRPQIVGLSKEQQRALPDSKGGEEPKSLQTYRTDISTYFTPVGGTHLLYGAENWVTIKLILETAGPVSVGTAAALTPVLSGKGISLVTGVPYERVLSKGVRFYIASETLNRVQVSIEPIPWLEQMDTDINRGHSILREVGNAIVGALGNLGRGGSPTKSSSGMTAADLPCPPGNRTYLPRLTGGPTPKKMR